MRVNGQCCGDCSKCELLSKGEVDMLPCMLDQVFQRMQKIERMLNEREAPETKIAGLPENGG